MSDLDPIDVDAEHVIAIAQEIRPLLQRYGKPREVFSAMMVLMVTETVIAQDGKRVAGESAKENLKRWLSACVDALWEDPS